MMMMCVDDDLTSFTVSENSELEISRITITVLMLCVMLLAAPALMIIVYLENFISYVIGGRVE